MQISISHPVLRSILVGTAVFTLVSLTGCATDGDVGATFDPLTAFPATAVWVWDDDPVLTWPVPLDILQPHSENSVDLFKPCLPPPPGAASNLRGIAPMRSRPLK